MNNKETLIAELFNKKWNYAWGNADNYLIGLFYSKDGFQGLLEMLESKKDSMKNYKNYYSGDLIETLQELIVLKATEQDFESCIKSRINFNYNNFSKLKELNLLQYYKDFGDNFRGIVVNSHSINNYTFIEVIKNKIYRFYPVIDNKINFCFNKLDEALLHTIYNGAYFDTLVTLLNSINKK